VATIASPVPAALPTDLYRMLVRTRCAGKILGRTLDR
jgi:hypothetical protein